MGLAMAGGTLMLGHTPVKAMGSPSLLRHLQQLDTDRILIILQLSGGNDGLNTVSPLTIRSITGAGPPSRCAGKPRLRFRMRWGCTLRWLRWKVTMATGTWPSCKTWVTRCPTCPIFAPRITGKPAAIPHKSTPPAGPGGTLSEAIPDFLENPPSRPLAVQIGRGGSGLFHGPNANMGMSLANSTLFERIATTGQLYSMENLPETTYGQEMTFMRRVVNDSFKFSGAIQDATQGDLNSVEYPQGSKLSEHLAITAQLIKGDLGARIYSVALNGFDTHANQINFHATLAE